MKTHDWTEADDAGALYVYKFGHQGIARSKSARAEALGINPDRAERTLWAIDVGRSRRLRAPN